MTLFLKKPYLLTLIIATAIGLWLLSGQMEEVTTSQKAAMVVPQKASPSIIQVRVREQQAQPLPHEIILTGHTAPLRTVTLRAEIEAQVEKIGAQRGTRVKKRDLIVRLATNDRALRLKEARALVKQRELEYKAMQKLSSRGYQSQVQIAEALTLLENAKTQKKQAQIALDRTTVRAPFDGILEQRFVEKGDYVSIGDSIAELIDEDPFLLIADVTEMQRHHLKLGDIAKARLVTGLTVTGKITLISVRANAATRTFHLEIKVPNPKGDLVAGVTCEIRIPVKTILAHKISAALLSLNDKGVLGVKTVDTNNRVIFYPAEFARASAEGIWLTNLPSPLRFITVGQGFVRAGDLVQPVQESEITLSSK